MRTAPSILALALVLVVTACSSGASDSPGGIRLEGVTWRTVTISGRPPAPNHVPSLTIVGSTISGSGGCNKFTAHVRVESSRLVVDELAMTAMACLDDVANTLEQQFVTILGSRPLIGARDGHLVLSGAVGEIVLESRGIAAEPTA
jgi:heat shock protein HslJ